MRNRDFHVFEEDIELPENVREKMDEAFRQVRDESGGKVIYMRRQESFPVSRGRRMGRLKRTATAALCAALLAAGIITAAAAVYSQWSRGMRGSLQASPQQQRELEEKGMAVILNRGTAGADRDQLPGYGADLSGAGAGAADGGNGNTSETSRSFDPVTDNGITVSPRMTIATRDCVWLSFSVDGFSAESGAQPDFGKVDVSFTDDWDENADWVNILYSFYDGIAADENARPVYDDGTVPNGPIEPRYTDEDGTMEFIIQMSSGSDISFLGKSLHIRLEELGTVARASFIKSSDGIWEFTIPLSGSDAYRMYTPNAPVGETGIVLEQAEISPISIRARLSVPEQANVNREYVSDLAYPCGVRLKDGTMLPYISDGGGGSFADETYAEYNLRYPFNRVIDPDQVDALTFLNPDAPENAEASERFIIVPIGNGKS